MSQITASLIHGIAPLCRDPGLWAPALANAAKRYDISTDARVAAWLANLAHESAEFNRLAENLNYSEKGLMATWPSRFPTSLSTADYSRNPEKIANKVYADRMGNGPEKSGDGWKYRGRGLAMLTGKDNYTRAGKALELPFVAFPELAAEKAPSALVAGWFWQTKGMSVLADAGNFTEVVRRWNGGLIGLEERRKYWARAVESLKQMV